MKLENIRQLSLSVYLQVKKKWFIKLFLPFSHFNILPELKYSSSVQYVNI